MATTRFGTDRLIACVTQRHHASAAASNGGAGDGFTADTLACAVEDREMRRVALGCQYCERLGTDLKRLASSIQMVIVIGGLDKGAGEQGEMPSPGTWSVYRVDGDPSVVGLIQPNGVGGQDEMRRQKSLAQQAHSVRRDWLGNASKMSCPQFVDHSAERPAKCRITDVRLRFGRGKFIYRQGDGEEVNAVDGLPG